MTHKEVAEILDRLGITAKKRWGQNFLCNDEISERIVEAAGIGHDDIVLEIGPGIGALTDKLCSSADRVLAVEIDATLAEYLRNRFEETDRFALIQEDYLKIESEKIASRIGRPQVIVSNLPYNLTTLIITKLMTEFSDARTMVLMVEEDACERIFSHPSSKSYGPISIITTAFGSKEKLFSVASQHFFPAPHTSSAVIRFSRDEKRKPITPDFVSFVRDVTATRRKTLVNTLSGNPKYSGDIDRIKSILTEHGYSPFVRAESLSADEFVTLYKQLEQDSC
ncbi:MAG: ribosomal RNA small subunit methyltransferase A [Clostridiales bacterium]|nr:ribosomal RNA small subunit methyltransferase A [Clostridiales bacterium]